MLQRFISVSFPFKASWFDFCDSKMEGNSPSAAAYDSIILKYCSFFISKESKYESFWEISNYSIGKFISGWNMTFQQVQKDDSMLL